MPLKILIIIFFPISILIFLTIVATIKFHSFRPCGIIPFFPIISRSFVTRIRYSFPYSNKVVLIW